jgi:polysaccharide pyruvyl transferase WcaK-like protein
MVAGGGLLNDHFGLGFLKLFASIAIAVRLRGARFAFSGIGVEGFRSLAGRALGRVSVLLADSVSVRDSPSAKNVVALGAKPVTVPDLGWLARRHLPPTVRPEDRTLVAFSIAVEHESKRRDREEIIRVAANEVLLKTTKDVVLVAMQSSSVPALDDSISLERISQSLGSERVSIVRPESYRDLYPVLQEASVVAGFRLHAAVLGVVAGCRIVSVSRSHKVKEALLNLPQCVVIDESELDSQSMDLLGPEIVAACALRPVESSDIAKVDDYCDVIEASLIAVAGGHK